MAKRAGLPWDAILGAEVSGAYKPQPEAYTRTAEVLSLAPADCMLVAAHNGDLRAARAAGFSTGFVPRPAEHGPGQATDLVAEVTLAKTGELTSDEILATIHAHPTFAEAVKGAVEEALGEAIDV